MTDRRLNNFVAFASLAVGLAACSSGPPSDTTSLNGADADVVAGSGTVTGMYGSESIAPIMAAYWIGQPDDPSEAHGGPFVYLFSSAVTCNDISVTGWLSDLEPSTQVLEMIIGTTSVGTPAPAASSANANVSEVNYLFGRPSNEVRARGGDVSLVAYSKEVSLDGSVNVTFPSGSADGTFHAGFCPGGQEESR